jgi:hypothetical protein
MPRILAANFWLRRQSIGVCRYVFGRTNKKLKFAGKVLPILPKKIPANFRAYAGTGA